MTDMRTDFELTLIEHLDFDVPCQMTRRGVPAYVVPSEAEVRAGWVKEEEAVSKAPTCGTCYCIAGFVNHQQGLDRAELGIERHAREALGIGREVADALFHCDNTIADVRRIAESIAGESL